jgi:hypothetical protein
VIPAATAIDASSIVMEKSQRKLAFFMRPEQGLDA